MHVNQFSSVQSLSRLRLFVTPWTAALQAFLSITNSRSVLRLMSIESVMPFNHLILCRSFLLLPSVFHSIRVSSNESVPCIRWPKFWSFSFGISPCNESAICVHTSPSCGFPTASSHSCPLQVTKEHPAELLVLCSRFPLAICFI